MGKEIETNSMSRDEMIMANQNLIWTVIHTKFPGIKMDKEDLFQQGQIALIRAVDTYDPKKGSLSTVACTAIYRELKRYIISSKGGLRIPEYLNSYMVNIAKTIQSMESKDMVITAESLAKELKIDVYEAKKALDNYRSASELLSLDASDGDNDPLMDTLVGEDPYKKVINGDQESYIKEILKSVYGKRDSNIIWDYFNEPDLTLEEIGERYGITKERVRQIIEKISFDSDKTKTKKDQESLRVLKIRLKKAYE